MTALPRPVFVPGWRGSGAAHWQRLWADAWPGAGWVHQADWEAPRRAAWVAGITAALERMDGPAVLVAHSLGCIAVAHLPAEVQARVAGALLVAPADPERRAVLSDFAPVPYAVLPYPSVVVGSTDDPFCPVRRARAYARSWGSSFVRLERAGHINVASGHGPWPDGLALPQRLVADAARPPWRPGLAGVSAPQPTTA